MSEQGGGKSGGNCWRLSLDGLTEGYDTADLTEARSILEALKLTAGRGHLWVHAVDFLITFEGPLSALNGSSWQHV